MKCTDVQGLAAMECESDSASGQAVVLVIVLVVKGSAP